MNAHTYSSRSAIAQAPAIGAEALAAQNHRFRGTGGVSRENRSHGFAPAFRDARTGALYPSRFANGTPAPMHVLDGLPDCVVVRRNPSGQVVQVEHSMVAGFIRDGRFYTREDASRAVAKEEDKLS